MHHADVCNLGAINLAEFVDEDMVLHYADPAVAELGSYAKLVVNESELRKTTAIAVRMLDNVIDSTDFPVDDVNARSRETRRIGLGIMGLADALMKAEVPYDSEEGRKVAGRMMGIIADEAARASEALAEEKGVFPLFSVSVFAKRFDAPRRNCALLTVAPTGTTSLVFNVSGGVEPYFALAYGYDKNAVLDGKTELSMGLNPLLYKKLTARFPDDVCAQVIAEVRKTGSILRGDEAVLGQIPMSFRRIFATSMDISPEDHVAMQAALQKHVDNSMSKTINLPNDATVDDVLRTYTTAWRNGCKGCTVYRDGSRTLQVLVAGEGAESEDEAVSPEHSDEAEGGACKRVVMANGTVVMSCSE